MTIADVCILIAALLPYIAAGYAKSSAPNFDNASPRVEGVFTGKALRAYNAQLNGFEAFPFFAVTVLFAEWRSTAHIYIDILAVIFIVLRIAHMYFYISNKPNLRSSIFSLGLLVTIIIFLLPIFFH